MWPRLVLPRLRRSQDPAAPAIATAVEAIIGRRIAPPEGKWIERIEQKRTSFAVRPDAIAGSLAPYPGRVAAVTPRVVAEVFSIRRPWGRFLFRLVRDLRPRSCLELGGGIGISAAYQGAALELNRAGRLVTIEGAKNRAAAASELLGELGLDRVHVVEAAFEEVLDEHLADLAPLDLVFLDAAKAREDNLLQFERLLPHFASGGALVMDDVHWSAEMKRTWREIRSHPRVALSADLWRLGVCVLRG